MGKNLGSVFLLLLSFSFLSGQVNNEIQSFSLRTPFEKNENNSANYQEIIEWYTLLSHRFNDIKVIDSGPSDIGRPIHTVVLSGDGTFDPIMAAEKNKLVVLINNGIHAGEPCGIDASMMLARDILMDDSYKAILKEIVIVIIPVYNIGGCLNRNSHTRANQNGPEAYGFRGNAQNLDLNRDFIKCDSRNAQTFNRLYNAWNPDVFIDTHTSNGADYSYTLTLIDSQKDKLAKPLRKFHWENFVPDLYQSMKTKWEMIPYVMSNGVPDSGIMAFLDLPRYSSGYAGMHHSFSFMTEAHMLKPFKDRVKSTYEFLLTILETSREKKSVIKELRTMAVQYYMAQDTIPITWKLDSERKEQIIFKGYTAKYKESEVHKQERLYYDRSHPYTKEIDYFPHYLESKTVIKPKAYIIPQAYTEVLDRLKWNKVQMTRLARDTVIEVELYRILSFDDRPQYEGHYLHSNTQIEKISGTRAYYKGDFVVSTDQEAVRYIVETLEPESEDSFFSWNFFDGILMQKEHFSAYVFEDLASYYLENNKEVRAGIDRFKKENPDQAKDPRAILQKVYELSPHYESTHKIYPVGRLMD